MDIFIAFILSWVSTVSGVMLGGYLVFKTKRESYESVFSPGEAKGASFNIEDEFGSMENLASSAEIPKPVGQANNVFMDQFAENLAAKAAKVAK